MAFDVEALFEAIDLISMKNIETEVSYDSTEICSIVDVSDRSNGRYLVTNGTIKYDAYSETTTYNNGDKVRVSVLNGDYAQKKFIVGKYVEDNNTSPITYKSPLNGVLKLTENLVTSTSRDLPYGLYANGSVKRQGLWQTSFENQQAQISGIYDTIAIQADFKTLLSNRKVRAGNFGLLLTITSRSTADNTKTVQHCAFLDSSEMFGNPYAFSIYSPQAKQIDISSIGTIESMSIQVYQGDNFEYLSDEGTLERLECNEDLNPNILVDNLYIAFGSNIANIEDNQIQLYSFGSNYYEIEPETGTNYRQIGFIWYNKDEDANYVGFGDGKSGKVKFPKEDDETTLEEKDYNELDYLRISEADSRLTAQIGKKVPTSKIGLNISASVDESIPRIRNCTDILAQTLLRHMNNFKNGLTNIGDSTFSTYDYKVESGTIKLPDTKSNVKVETYFDNFVGGSGIVKQIVTDLEDVIKELQAFYPRALEVGYLLQRLNKSEELTDEELEFLKTAQTDNLHTQAYDAYEAINTLLTALKKLYYYNSNTQKSNIFYDLKHHLNTNYNGYMSVYATYSTLIDNCIKALIDEFNLLLSSLKDIDTQMQSMINVTDFKFKNDDPTKEIQGTEYEFTEYVQKDLTQYDNRYSVYWYKYKKDYYDKNERFCSKGWEMIKGTDGKPITTGLPTEEDKDNQGYLVPKFLTGEGMYGYTLDSKLKEEKFKIVLIYNHVKYESKELVFTNKDDIPDPSTKDSTAALYIGHHTNSQDVYQLYGIDNYLLDYRDKNTVRQVIAHYDGLLGGDEKLAEKEIRWYIPKESTMLEYNKKDYSIGSENGFSSDIDGESNVTKDGYTCFYKTIRKKENGDGTFSVYEEDLICPYHIKKYYEKSNSNNGILCDVVMDKNTTISAVLYFDFSTFGTSGTDYTLLVDPRTHQISVVGVDKMLELDIKLFDYNNQHLPIYSEANPTGDTQNAAYNFKIEWVGPTAIDDESNTLIYSLGGSIEKSELTLEDGTSVDSISGCTVQLLTKDNVNSFTGKGNIIKATSTFALKYDKTKDEEEEEESVETAAEEPEPTPDEDEKDIVKEINLVTFYPIPYSASENYYISGATVICYDSQGANPSYYKNPYKLFKNGVEVDGKIVNNQYVENQIWKIVYYDADGKVHAMLDDDVPAIYKNYLPYLTADNALKPSVMYLEGFDWYPAVRCYVDDTIQWEQPLYIFQNRYPSNMLNAWDGSFTIDEENGTIMSTMVGAGRKTMNNTFEGVLMGDLEHGAGFTADQLGFQNGNNVGENPQTGLGIYGFHDGAQSFGLNIDGSAFFGKAGAGRIIFNGNNGILASANWFSGVPEADEATGEIDTPYKGTIDANGKIKTPSNAGMCIDLDDGYIDAYNFRLTSQNIYMNSNPTAEKDYYFRIGSDGTAFRGQIGQKRTDGYLALDKNGNLDIKVNSLSITEMLGGANLLKQTQPTKTTPQYQLDASGNPKTDETGEKLYVYDDSGDVEYNWDVDTTLVNPYTSQWDSTENTKINGTDVIYKNNTEDDDNPKRSEDYICISTDRDEDNRKSASIYQIVKKIKPGKKYTVSGYVRRKHSSSDTTSTFNVIISNSKDLAISDANLNKQQREMDKPEEKRDENNFFNITNKDWFYFERNVILNTVDEDEDIKDKEITITFTSPVDFYLYHAKFEEGNIATDWSLSRWDVQQGNDSTKNTYDQYLTQDKIFKKLITNPTNGEQMVGIWMIDTDPTDPSKKLSRKELYINATYMATGILRSSNWDGSLVTTPIYQRNADGTIKTNSSGEKLIQTDCYGKEQYTYTVTGTVKKGMYINLNEGKLWAASFELNAWDYLNGATKGHGLYLNSDPANDTDYYLKLGDLAANYITFTKGGTLLINTNKFKLSTSTMYISDEGATLSVTGASRSNIVLKMGDNFGVSSTGILYAQSANLNGSLNGGSININDKFIVDEKGNCTAKYITATVGGKIGGWTIDGNKLTSGTMTINGTNGTISSTGGGAFKVDGGTGTLTATGATLDTLTVNKSLYVAKGGGNGTLSVEGNTTIDGNTTIKGEVDLKNAVLKVNGKVAYTGENDGKWIKVDAPWTGNNYQFKIENGIITDIKPLTSAITDLWNKIVGLFGGKKVSGETTTTVTGQDLGSKTKFIYLKGGDFKETDKTVGDDQSPVYMDAGVVTECKLYGYTTSAADHKYKLSKDSSSGAYVNVSVASSDGYGVVKLGYTENGKNYPVEKNSSGQLYVNVPWTDTTQSLDGYATTSWVSSNFCSETGPIIKRIQERLGALEAKI